MDEFVTEYNDGNADINAINSKETHPNLRQINFKKIFQGIYKTGFVAGKYSDITVNALGCSYKLHKIILHQNPYFCGMLNRDFLEANLSVIELKFDDDNITQEGLNYVFARIYGHTDKNPTSQNARNVLACASYFGDVELTNLCLDFISQDINPSNIGEYLTFSQRNYYGPISDSIIDTIFTYFCKNLNGVDRAALVGVLSNVDFEFMKMVLGADCLFVKDEVERFEIISQVVENMDSLQLDDDGISVSSEDEDETTLVINENDDRSNDDESSNSITIRESNDTPLSSQVLPSVLPIIQPAPWTKPLLPKIEKNLLVNNSKTSILTKIETLSILNPTSIELLTHSVIFTHIPFATLQKIQNKNLIPTQTLQQAHWTSSNLQRMIEGTPSSIDSLGIDDGDGEPTDDTKKIDGRRLRDLFVDKNLHVERKYAPFRFGVEFLGLDQMESGVRVYSNSVYYGGSFWVVYLQKILVEGVFKLGVYLQRNGIDDPTIFSDKRTKVNAWFKMFCFVVRNETIVSGRNLHSDAQPGKCFILESKPDVFKHNQSWGWRSHKLFRESFLTDDVESKPEDFSSSLRCCVVIGLV